MRLLTDPSIGFQGAVQRIVDDPELRTEVGVALHQLEREMRPCGPNYVIEQLTPLVTLYGVADRSDSEWKAFWNFYVQMLKEIPKVGIRRGVQMYVEAPESLYFPKPGQIKQLCVRGCEDLYIAYGRAKKAYFTDPKPQVTNPVGPDWMNRLLND